MKTEKIDNIIKEFLLSRGLTLHYYVPCLLNALTCLRELSFDFDLGKNIKEVELVPNAFNRVDIPYTCVELIGVFGMFGGERRLIRYNEKISLLTDNVSYGITETTLSDATQNNGSVPFETVGPYELPQQAVLGVFDKYSYNVDKEREQIVLGVGHELQKVYLRYESSFVVTGVNLVHPYVIPVINSFISYMYDKASGDPMNRLAESKATYFNEKRLLKSRLNPMTIVDYYKILCE